MKKPWLEEGSPWKTESSFWGWVRGVLRKGWSKHPIKLEYIKRNRKRIINPKEKARARFPEVWGMTCEVCKTDTVQSEIEIDHIGEQGKFTGLDDIKDYAAHLFLVDFTSLRSVCKPCHKVISYSQKTGLSFEAALAEKRAIDYMKSHNVKEILDYCVGFGYNARSLSNAQKRREALVAIFSKEKV